MIDYILGKVKMRASRRTYYGYGGYGDREDYYQNLFTERHPNTILRLLAQKEDARLDSHQDVRFRNIDFGATTKTAQKQLGKPRYIIENLQVARHEVRFYRLKVNRLHSVAALHFLEDQLFLASHTFRHLDRLDYQRVVTALSDKYGLPASSEAAVKDASGNTVSVVDGLYFTVQYVSGDPSFPQQVARYATERAQHEQLREAERLSSISDFL